MQTANSPVHISQKLCICLAVLRHNKLFFKNHKFYLLYICWSWDGHIGILLRFLALE